MFEQRWILWGLPLVLVPLIIHLLNRLRFRSMNWAAMMFLLAATRHSTRQARIKQLLILLCRMLAVAFLVFALSRPVVGGWLGVAFRGPPETIILVLDRSASMEAETDGAGKSKRQHALELITAGIERNNRNARLVLVENAMLQPQEVPNPDLLPELPTTQPTDCAADIPAMLEAALTYMIDNETGRTEIWVVSDLQHSNWHPDQTGWETLMTQFRSLDRNLQFRLLALPAAGDGNLTLALRDVVRYQTLGKPELQLAFDVIKHGEAAAEFPVKVQLGAQPEEDLDTVLEGGELTVKHRVKLAAGTGRGWGRMWLPDDSNEQDNRAWFVFDEDRPLHSAVIAENLAAGRYLQPAAAVLSQTELKAPKDFAQVDLSNKALVIWQGTLPPAPAQERLQQFVEDGGVLFCLPPEKGAGSLLGKLSWGDIQQAPGDKFFDVVHWDRQHGPLANTASGWVLPVDELSITRRREPLAAGETLAEFADDRPFLVRLRLGRGQVAAGAVLPHPDWSDLHHSTVLVPLLQRLLYQGGKRLAKSRMLDCGAFEPGPAEDWRPLAGTKGDPRWNAGVYELGDRRIALNRPRSEDLPKTVTRDKIDDLFGSVPLHLFTQNKGEGKDAMPSEIWRLMLYLMLIVMVLESLLTLPSRLTAKETADAMG